MANFNTARQFQTALFVRADVAFDDIAQIDKFRLGSIAAEVEAGIVVVVFVRTDNPVCAFFGGEIGIDFTFEADRAERAAVCAELFNNRGRTGHGQWRFHAGQFFRLDVVKLMITTQQQ